MRVQSLGQEDPVEEGMAICSSILAGKCHEQRSLVGYSPWGPRESDTTEHACTLSTQNMKTWTVECSGFEGSLALRELLI